RRKLWKSHRTLKCMRQLSTLRQGGVSGDLRRGQELVPRCGRKPAVLSAAQSAVRYSGRVSILRAHRLWRDPKSPCAQPAFSIVMGHASFPSNHPLETKDTKNQISPPATLRSKGAYL